MSPNQNSENTELVEFSRSISRPANACEILSQSEKMTGKVLATLLGKPKPALIPIVRFRVAGKHAHSLKKMKLKSTQHRYVISVNVQKISEP